MARRRGTKEETRDALVGAALELFATDGLDVSLDDICARAGYTRGAFYVHFADRDALLVAVMDKVGEAFLASVFAQLTPLHAKGPAKKPSLLAEAAERFVTAIEGGAYPLMAPPTGTRAKNAAPQIRFHQLLDACARSEAVRARYRTLVEASAAQVAGLVRLDQENGALGTTLSPDAVGALVLAASIGAQTMAELGVPISPRALAATILDAVAR